MQSKMRPLIHHSRSMIVRVLVFAFILLPCGSAVTLSRQTPAQAGAARKKLEISRTARPWEFLAAVGKRAGLLGNESGKVEAWVYLHDSLVHTVISRPKTTPRVDPGNRSSIRETFVVPVDQPGAVIEIQVETEQPLELEASFVRDFQLEWPASMGGTYVGWSS